MGTHGTSEREGGKERERDREREREKEGDHLQVILIGLESKEVIMKRLTTTNFIMNESGRLKSYLHEEAWESWTDCGMKKCFHV